MRKALIVLIFLLIAFSAYTQEADRNILMKAEAGDPFEQFLAGLEYSKLGNHNKAFDWYLKSANQNNVEAQTMLGKMYESGVGIRRDLAKAAEWYKKGTEQGSVEAQTRLGALYKDGRGVRRDYRLAADYLTRAATQGSHEAQRLLGDLYWGGHIGSAPNRVTACAWYFFSKDSNSIKRCNQLSQAEIDRSGYEVERYQDEYKLLDR
ncbi:MAG: sel1 repeat family protein [Deferribacteraceae bacterium]|jgi:TPR repeat protein|nr:sel1 repeat family protein [Deferribacteraceae bacterium]